MGNVVVRKVVAGRGLLEAADPTVGRPVAFAVGRVTTDLDGNRLRRTARAGRDRNRRATKASACRRACDVGHRRQGHEEVEGAIPGLHLERERALGEGARYG